MNKKNKESIMTKSEILLYHSSDGEPVIQVRLENETVWLNQAQMAELFSTTKQNISLHIKNILAEGELDEKATVKEYLTVQKEEWSNSLTLKQIVEKEYP
jgi:hypothetical protein